MGNDLDVDHSSMNALMQYLKRRGLVKKAGDAFHAPHEITAEGQYVRQEMNRRAGQADGRAGGLAAGERTRVG